MAEETGNSRLSSANSDFSDVRMPSRSTFNSMSEDERRLYALGYKQEVKRIFSAFTNFGLAASMISILLGIIPLYTYQLTIGGPVVMIWTWIVVGSFTLILVCCLGEICSAYPTMGALYFWAFKLGGSEWGPFWSWVAGWCNLLGQIAGVASGGYAGAQIIGEVIALSRGYGVSSGELICLYGMMLVVAGIVNTFAELMLTALCYISVAWQIAGTLVIVISMLCMAPSLQTASFVFTEFNNSTGFQSVGYIALIGALAAGSTFTGYDTAAHVAEETTHSHNSTPWAMILAVVNALVLGFVLIVGMNFCIQDISSLVVSTDDDGSGPNQAYTILWQQTVGDTGAIAFLFITLVAIECSNCANLTSAARMLYSFSRDGALPFSKVWYNIDPRFGGPVRAIWLCLLISFILGLPGLYSSTVLGALFSLTATGLYASYVIPIGLRVTVARDTFKPAEFNLGKYSVPMGIISVLWGLFITSVLCLPQATPTNQVNNLNYSPIALGAIILYAVLSWYFSASKWYKVAVEVDLSLFGDVISPQFEECATIAGQSSTVTRVTSGMTASGAKKTIQMQPSSSGSSGQSTDGGNRVSARLSDLRVSEMVDLTSAGDGARGGGGGGGGGGGSRSVDDGQGGEVVAGILRSGSSSRQLAEVEKEGPSDSRIGAVLRVEHGLALAGHVEL